MPETGRVAPGAAPCGRASFSPESRPQLFRIARLGRRGPQPRDVLRLALQEVRSGEWVTEPGRTARPPATGTRPPRAWCVHEFFRARVSIGKHGGAKATEAAPARLPLLSGRGQWNGTRWIRVRSPSARPT